MNKILQIKISEYCSLKELDGKAAGMNYANDLVYLLIHRNASEKDEIRVYDIFQVKDNTEPEKVFSFESINMDMHFIRLLNDGNFLLASARCRFYDEDNIENNVFIVNGRGEIQKTYTLGDGIQDIKIDGSEIWVCYFDEGVFGNYGWDIPDLRIGREGLACFNYDGEMIYGYNSKCGDEHFITDCYALNIDDKHNKWFYYYDEFMLGKLDKENKGTYFRCDSKGTGIMLVYQDYILMGNGCKHRDLLTIYKLTGEELIKITDLNLYEASSVSKLEIEKVSSNEEYLLICEKDKLYFASLKDLVKRLDLG